MIHDVQENSIPVLLLKQHFLHGLHIDQEEHHNTDPQQLLAHRHPEEQHLLTEDRKDKLKRFGKTMIWKYKI